MGRDRGQSQGHHRHNPLTARALTYPHSIISLIMALMVGTAVSRKMDDLPMWLQYYPKILFDTINRSGTGVITKAATHTQPLLRD